MLKRVRRGLLLKAILLVFFVYASAQIIELQIQIYEKKQAIAEYQVANEELETANESKQNDIDKGLTDEQVEKIAREKLGLASPDETVFVGVPG
ncbi:Cell division protein FtsL [bioreactor metagenome]|uniref:Cell division protein FtsL n=1 Tax=bioreactor metagenome TaxID=1076179 RepID=A0A644Y9V7_9ZZZZ